MKGRAEFLPLAAVLVVPVFAAATPLLQKNAIFPSAFSVPGEARNQGQSESENTADIYNFSQFLSENTAAVNGKNSYLHTISWSVNYGGITVEVQIDLNLYHNGSFRTVNS